MRPPRFYRRFDYDRSLLPNRVLAELEEGVTDIESAKKKSGLTIGYPGWGLLYSITLCTLHPERENTILETGSNLGCSTIVLGQALADSKAPGSVQTIEIDADTAARARANIERAGLAGRVTLHEGDSKAVLPRLLEKTRAVRVAFLDGSHDYADIKREFDLVEPKVEPRGVVIFDNTANLAEAGEDARVHGVLREIVATGRGQLVNFEFVSWHTPGIAVWQKDPLADSV